MPTEEQGFNWRAQRILVIDRDEQFRFFAQGLFRHQRAEIVQAAADMQALPQIVNQHRMTLAFLELADDDAPLCRVLKWLRKASASRDLPVLLLAKRLEREQIARVCGFGIHGILQKPLSGEQLMKAVRGVATTPKLLRLSGRGIAETPITVAPDASPPVAAAADVPPPPPATAEEPAVAPPAPEETPAPPEEVPATPPASPLALPPPRPLMALPSPRPLIALPGPIRRFLPGPSRTGAAGAAKSGAKGSGDSGGIETIPAAAPGRVAGMGIELADAPMPAKKAGGLETAGDAKKSEQKRTVETAAPPAAKPAPLPIETIEAPSPASRQTNDMPSLDAVLAAHRIWIESAGKGGERARLEGKELAGLDLKGANLASALLRRADCSACDFREAALHGVDFRNADLQGVCFEGADLSVARLRHARLRGSRLAGANLKGADLAGADLAGCDFADAALDGANLLGTDLSGTDLSGAKGLNRGQLDGVTGDSATRLPPGLRLPSSEGGDASADKS